MKNKTMLNKKPKKERKPLVKNSKGLFKRPPGKTPKGKKWNPQNGQWKNE